MEQLEMVLVFGDHTMVLVTVFMVFQPQVTVYTVIQPIQLEFLEPVQKIQPVILTFRIRPTLLMRCLHTMQGMGVRLVPSVKMVTESGALLMAHSLLPY